MATFEQFTNDDAADLIGQYPLAWVRPVSAEPLQASLLPLLVERDGDGAIVALNGHMARRNPLYAALTERPTATILFTGPNGYISPTWVRDPQWGPTWNFAQLRIEVEIAFNPDGGDESLTELVAVMEADNAPPWRVENMGSRYRELEQQIIAFRATVVRLAGTFKLGQDERPEILGDILAHLGDNDLARWMRRMNAGRC